MVLVVIDSNFIDIDMANQGDIDFFLGVSHGDFGVFCFKESL